MNNPIKHPSLLKGTLLEGTLQAGTSMGMVAGMAVTLAVVPTAVARQARHIRQGHYGHHACRHLWRPSVVSVHGLTPCQLPVKLL